VWWSNNPQGAGSGTGDIGLEYTKPHFAVKSELDISLEKSKSSAVFAYEGAKVKRRPGRGGGGTCISGPRSHVVCRA
jgi:hypothetical protein